MQSKVPVLIKKAPFIFTLALILSSLSLFVFGSDENTPKSKIKFELTDINGDVWNSKDLEGSIVVFNFWFSSCPPCKKEIPELNKLVDEYSDRNVVFIGVSLNNEDEVENFTYMHPFKYKLIPNGSNFVDAQKISSFPTQLIIDKDGMLVDKIVGGVSFETMKEQIEKLCNN
ncbi:MAG: TlpA disulfide reductase family protein [Bacteroidota bacterium]